MKPRRRGGWIVLLLAVGLAAVSQVSCGPTSTGRTANSNSGHYAVATHDDSQTLMLARATGMLRGQANSDGTACFWLGDQAGHQLDLVWPIGYFAGGEPLALFDKSGAKVAAVGQNVDLAGGMAPNGHPTPAGCTPATAVWLVGEVTLATAG